MKPIKSFCLFLFLIMVGTVTAQTILKGIPIITESGDSVLIEMLSYDEENEDSVWVNITENYWEYDHGWYATGEINAKVRKDVEYRFRFLTGSKSLDCFEYTYLTIRGSKEKVVIKNTKENPIEFDANGPDLIYPVPKI